MPLQTQQLTIERPQSGAQISSYVAGEPFNRDFLSAERPLTSSQLRGQRPMTDAELAWELQRQEDLLASRFSPRSSYLDSNVEYDYM
jgi:hypothetical protein